ncbi:MAG: hypothetical protein MUF08_02325 [Burkholderiaceae bacterium]|nr:hypothetical protein [Burkholderiaceae bacterium]
MQQLPIHSDAPGAEPVRRAMTLPVVAVLAAAAMLSLAGLQLALRLPGGQGIEDVLGWTRASAVRAAVDYWRTPLSGGGRWHVEAAYVLVDTWLFMPLYAVLLGLLLRALHDTLLRDFRWADDLSPLGRWMGRWLPLAGAMMIVALLVVDAVENLGGALRVGVHAAVYGACLAAGAVLGAALWTAATHDDARRRRQAWQAMALAFVGGAVLVGWGVFGPIGASVYGATEPTDGVRPSLANLGAQAHTLKTKLVPLVMGCVALAWLLWLYGADRVPDHLVDESMPNLRAYRAQLRSGIAAVVWRTRYVLLVLVLFAGLTLGLDQCRDVLLALAHWSTRDVQGAPVLHRLGMIVMVGVAVTLFVYSTWLWARLACRIRGQAAMLAGTVAVRGAPADGAPSWELQLQRTLGTVARTWARALSLVPLLCMYALVAFAISDAINAAAAAPDGTHMGDSLFGTVVTLILIGLLTVGLGAVFLMTRRALTLADEADYFNREEGLYELLLGQAEGKRPQAPEPGPTFWGQAWAAFWRGVRRFGAWTVWLTPRTLPPVALALMWLIRLGLAWTPDTMSAIPAALALVTLTLTWWMGVAGALTLAEVRLGRPYGLFLIVLLGALAVLPLGVGNNHVLPLTLPVSDPTALKALRMDGLAVAAALMAVMSGLWWLFTTDLPVERWNQAALQALHRRRAAWRQALARLLDWAVRRGVMQTALRAAGVVLGVGLAMGTLRMADRHALHVAARQKPAPARTAPAEVPTLAKAVADWSKQLDSATAGPVYLVASEGGGIRSAYWTAQVLATLRASIDDFDQRTFAMSGVSGGAVGIAAYSACLRSLPPEGLAVRGAVRECVTAKFSALDPLSPLLAAWLWEDALARLLPVPMAADASKPGWRCLHPACAHLSRAVGFEREWVRALPELAQPLASVGGPGGRWEPHLLLNSTWVESGELAPVASVVIDPEHFPAARDVQRRLGRELSLIGAAHVAARFPFINPLAAVQPASGAASGAAARAARAVRGEASAEALIDGKVDGHLADGGYFDNSAAAALTPVWREVRARVGPTRDVVVVLIRNGQKPAACERTEPDGPSNDKCIVPDREPMPDAKTLAVPTRSRNWNLYADMLGPAVTVLNVSGIGAHGRHAPAALRADAAAAFPAAASPAASASVAASSASAPATRVRLVDQQAIGTLVPLGWYLSPTARAALEREADALSKAWQAADAAGR